MAQIHYNLIDISLQLYFKYVPVLMRPDWVWPGAHTQSGSSIIRFIFGSTVRSILEDQDLVAAPDPGPF